MPLEEDEIARIAHLARLAIDEAQVRRYAGELGHILELVEQMNEVDTEGVVPMAHPLDMSQRLRADEVTEVDRRAKLQEGAPAIQDGLYLVPRMIE